MATYKDLQYAETLANADYHDYSYGDDMLSPDDMMLDSKPVTKEQLIEAGKTVGLFVSITGCPFSSTSMLFIFVSTLRNLPTFTKSPTFISTVNFFIQIFH